MDLTIGLGIIIVLLLSMLVALNRTLKKIDEEEKAKFAQEKSNKS